MNPRELLLESFHAALAAADPLKIVPQHLPHPPKGRTLVVGAGKAAASMALAVERTWPSDAPLEGVVITRYHHGLPTQRIKVVEAGHPVPDESGEQAARQILAAVQSLRPDDQLIALVSGGGSSLLSLPVEGLSMGDLKGVTNALLRSGATIQEINTIRKHLSAIQGGRLAAACRAPILSLVVSDVTGDDPTHIASGPCAADSTTYADALDILARYRITEPQAAIEILYAGQRGERPESIKPGDPLLHRTENRVIANSHSALQAAAAFFAARGISAAVLGDSVTGEAREVAKVYGALAREVRFHAQPWKPPVVLLSGGETTVTVGGAGRGGRNAEFLLSLAIDLDCLEGVHALACDTDGIDGSEDNAGACIAPDELTRAQAMGINAGHYLSTNDAYGFFEKMGGLIVTGPTRTNVNDYRAILVL